MTVQGNRAVVDLAQRGPVAAAEAAVGAISFVFHPAFVGLTNWGYATLLPAVSYMFGQEAWELWADYLAREPGGKPVMPGSTKVVVASRAPLKYTEYSSVW